MIRTVAAAALVASLAATSAFASWAHIYGPLQVGSRKSVAAPSNGAVVASSGLKNVLFTIDPEGKVLPARQFDEQIQTAVSGPGESIFIGSSQGTPAGVPKPAAPEPVPATKLMKPEPGKQIGSPSPLLARPRSQWPQIVMENEITIAGEAKRRITSFLVETAKGIVAVSAVPDQTNPKDRGITNLQRRMSAWKMWSPEEPKRVMSVASIVTADNAPRNQYGVAVALAPMKGKLPVHPLKPGRSRLSLGSRVFVVACTWSSSGCSQSVIEGEIAFESTRTGTTLHTYAVGIMARLERADLAGAAVLDEDGNVVAVMNGVESDMLSPRYATIVAADDLENVLP
jgi:hypothetical protein